MNETVSPANASTLQIGAVAERTGLSLRTLRHYDEVGLLTPSGRTAGGFRLYTERDLERLLLIRRMKPLGFTLEQMADLLEVVEVLSGDSDEGTVVHRQRLDGYVAAAESRRADLATKLAMADEFISTLRNSASVGLPQAPV